MLLTKGKAQKRQLRVLMAARVKLAANKKEQERHDNLAGDASSRKPIEWSYVFSQSWMAAV